MTGRGTRFLPRLMENTKLVISLDCVVDLFFLPHSGFEMFLNTTYTNLDLMPISKRYRYKLDTVRNVSNHHLKGTVFIL